MGCAAPGALLRHLGSQPDRVDPSIARGWTRRHHGLVETRYTFMAEVNAPVPCHLLWREGAGTPLPVVICLQGHSSGMHLSLGRARTAKDWVKVRYGGRDIARQALAQGYAALVFEQRCFGERADGRPRYLRQNKHTCHHTAMTALLLGRTLMGERVWDLMRAIDTLSEFPEIDTNRIAVAGHSAGGSVACYAACLDERIKAVVASCCLCTWYDSIGTRDHCMDNYLPGAALAFEMSDLAGLIAPRPLVIASGEQDRIFPIEGARKTAAAAAEIYKAMGAEAKCAHVVGSGGHHFYPGLIWPVFGELTGWGDGC